MKARLRDMNELLCDVAILDIEVLCFLCRRIIASLPASKATLDASQQQKILELSTFNVDSIVNIKRHVSYKHAYRAFHYMHLQLNQLYDYWRRALYEAKKAVAVINDFREVRFFCQQSFYVTLIGRRQCAHR